MKGCCVPRDTALPAKVLPLPDVTLHGAMLINTNSCVYLPRHHIKKRRRRRKERKKFIK
jgi:hypothetical protein